MRRYRSTLVNRMSQIVFSKCSEAVVSIFSYFDDRVD